MTREEAIRIFRKEIECLSHTKCEDCILKKACDPMTTTPFDSEYIEAYNMAIKALEQEPIPDKIRAEIDTYLENEGFGSEYRNDVKKIIDKYKAEQE